MLSSQRAGIALPPSESQSLEELLQLDVDDINDSATGSMTSPSEYSAHSRRSPGGSLVGTPGWDLGSIGFHRSVSSTPAHVAGEDRIDSYFDAITSHDGSIAVTHKGCGRVENGTPAPGGAFLPPLPRREGGSRKDTRGRGASVPPPETRNRSCRAAWCYAEGVHAQARGCNEEVSGRPRVLPRRRHLLLPYRRGSECVLR